jgi:hypothetical protein
MKATDSNFPQIAAWGLKYMDALSSSQIEEIR